MAITVTLYKTNCLALTVTIPPVDKLVEQCINGNTAAYRSLYDRYSRAMYNTALRITGNKADAEDILQEAFSDAFFQLRSLGNRMTFGAWLKQIVVFKSVSLLKKRRLLFTGIDNDLEDIPSKEDNQEPAYSVEGIRQAIQRLPDGYRTVLSLYLLEGYDHEEIAEILQVAQSTVRTQYIRAKQKLRQLLKKEDVHD